MPVRITYPFDEADRRALHDLDDWLEQKQEEAYYTGDDGLQFQIRVWRKVLLEKLLMRSK